MIPHRRPRIRPIEEMEITDDDIVEVKPKPRSGTYARVLPPPVPTNSDPIVRVSLESLSDDEYAMMDTALNDVTVALARLSLENRTATRPRLRGAVELNGLSAEEAWLVSLVTAGFDVHAIIVNSPRSEEDTLTLLGSLIKKRIITLEPISSKND